MSGLGYSVAFENASVTGAAQDLWVGSTGGSTAITIQRIGLTWARTTQENVRYALLTRSAAGSGGASATPAAMQRKNTTASGVTWTKLVTTPGAAVAGGQYDNWYWNLTVPFDLVCGKLELEYEIPVNTIFAFALLGSPAGAYSASSSIIYTER